MMGTYMKKIFATASTAGLYLLAASQAFAQIPVDPCPKNSNQFGKLCNFGPSGIGGVINTAVVIILVIAVLISLFFLIWGGIKWILSGGDKSAVEGARNHIVAAIVGLIIAFLAYFILQLVLGFFGLSLTVLQLPSLPGTQ